MSAALAAASAGFILGGPIGGLLGALTPWAARLHRRPKPSPNQTRLLLMVLLVAARSGLSVLAALQSASTLLIGNTGLQRVTRLATVAGLTASISGADPEIRPIIAQLARAQTSGASIGGTLRSMLERHLAEERGVRMARARSLPVRLMVPVTLLMLPGLVLLLYAPSLLGLFNELTGVWR